MFHWGKKGYTMNLGDNKASFWHLLLVKCSGSLVLAFAFGEMIRQLVSVLNLFGNHTEQRNAMLHPAMVEIEIMLK